MPGRVLVVDDEATQMRALCDTLRNHGYDTVGFSDTRAALDALREARFDLLLTDLMMPDMSGIELLRQGLEIDAALAGVIMTGQGTIDTAVQALQAGALDYILKPFKLSTVLPVLSRAMTIRHLRLHNAELERQLRVYTSSRLTAIVESSDDAIIGKDLDGVITSWNAAAVGLFGHSDVEAIGRSLTESIPSDRQEEDTQTLAKVRRGESVRNFDTQRLTKDGRVVDVAITTSPIRDDSGQVIGVSEVVRDITERHSLERQYRQAQKMEAVGQLAGGVAHDFNNLLTAILGYAAILAERFQSDEHATSDIEEIRKAGERAAGLTRQLLAFSRQQMLQPVVVDLNIVTENLVNMLRRLIGEHIELKVVLDPKLGSIRADPGQIEQVIMNLAVNARDAMPKGGCLTIETANLDLDESYAASHRLTAESAGPFVMLAVSDTGMGMDEETKRRIFEPFFTTKPREQGTGLGLATVYGIVKQSGGYVWVYSEPSQGATFKIYLPRVDEAPRQTSGNAGATDIVRGGSETILLVEDEESVRLLSRTLLEREGYRVLDAASPAEAVTKVAETVEPIHLLLSDVMMPGETGPALFQRLHETRPEMKVLYLSGYADQAIINRGILDAGSPFLQKPYSARGLARKVRDTLDAGK